MEPEVSTLEKVGDYNFDKINFLIKKCFSNKKKNNGTRRTFYSVESLNGKFSKSCTFGLYFILYLHEWIRIQYGSGSTTLDGGTIEVNAND